MVTKKRGCMLSLFSSRRTLSLSATFGIVAGLLASALAVLPVQASAAPHTWHAEVGMQSPDMAVSGMVFLPETITIDAGDTIIWQANSAEPHTVTFNAPTGAAFNPFAGNVGGHTISGTAAEVSSGTMATVPQSEVGFPTEQTYSLTFTKAGQYTYTCLVHPGMVGHVVVNPAGTPYPETQRQYDIANHVQEANIIASGYRLLGQEDAASARTGGHTVYAGGTDMMTGADLMRYALPTVVVRVGQSVDFVNPTNSMEPHTVTFGSEAGAPCSADVPFCHYGTPANYTGGQLNSGWMFPGQHFAVTFTKTGTYTYHCALHDYMGMVGTIIVVP